MAERNIISRKEIDSHSTMITNERIGEIKNVVWRKATMVLSSQPNPITANEFFTIICEWYIETPLLFDVETNITLGQELRRLITIGESLRDKLMLKGNLTIPESIKLIRISLRMQYIMNIAMQNLGYYFKISTPEPKGFDDALRIFGMEVNKPKEEIKEYAGE